MESTEQSTESTEYGEWRMENGQSELSLGRFPFEAKIKGERVVATP
jgi:hypothetical protein